MHVLKYHEHSLAVLLRVLALLARCRGSSTMSADAPPFQQTLAKKQAAGSYLLRVNPVAVMANLSCNLETGDRSVQPKASWWGGYRVI